MTKYNAIHTPHQDVQMHALKHFQYLFMYLKASLKPNTFLGKDAPNLFGHPQQTRAQSKHASARQIFSLPNSGGVWT